MDKPTKASEMLVQVGVIDACSIEKLFDGEVGGFEETVASGFGLGW